MIDQTAEARRLEALGIWHAPEQHFLDPDGRPTDKVDGRYVTLQSPPGVYYLLGTDNRTGRDPDPRLQLIFIGDPAINSKNVSDNIAEKIGRKVVEFKVLPGSTGDVPVTTAMLAPL